MTKDKIHALIEIVAGHTEMPIKGFEVKEYEYIGELHVSVTFQSGEPKVATVKEEK